MRFEKPGRDAKNDMFPFLTDLEDARDTGKHPADCTRTETPLLRDLGRREVAFVLDVLLRQERCRGRHGRLALILQTQSLLARCKIRWLMGTHQGAVSHKHLDYYLDEFTFRFNRRKSKSRGKLFFRLVQQALLVE